MVRARNILKSGQPLFVFPEGTRGKDGRMGDFKLGAFRLATKMNVPIIPVSISGTHLVMPTSVLMPQRRGSDICAVHVHPAIPVDGRTDAELAAAAFEVINDALPEQQKYLTPPTESA
jgi:1-acyl-sn-glycerol-3-phosphate acyltransferase